MNLVYSNFNLPNGVKLYYEIIETENGEAGFNIYAGENSKYPYLHQPEPFIPDRSLTYVENALKMCEELSLHVVPKTQYAQITIEEFTQIQSNIDYLLLLNE